MTLVDRLRDRRDHLLHIKSKLYWYGGRGWDTAPGRVCLIMDARHVNISAWPAALRGTVAIGNWAYNQLFRGGRPTTDVQLIIDGTSQWVCVAAEDVEILDVS